MKLNIDRVMENRTLMLCLESGAKIKSVGNTFVVEVE